MSSEVTLANTDSAKEACRKGSTLGDKDAEVNVTLKPVLIQQYPQKIFKLRHSFEKFKMAVDSLVDSLKVVYCHDAKTKFELLDKIDKTIRKGLKKDRERYKAIQGTCADMCPEKERYLRVDRNQISPYEQNPLNAGEMDSKKAVKEYSRSSADQDEPLPHELRPPAVLQVTMNYLIRNFMHEELSNRSDWFDFLWNRTRAIRKDITQQNTKCKDSIDLIEKCARFHILCSHHLCEQEMHIFDAKINLENLTKCLQTLKHMYEDAHADLNMQCQNESEFRGYQILLNLNNTDTLREVTEFSSEVRASSPVKFALAVMSSVHENNYVCFFKLLRKASFLCGCLMHPYFTQIRAVALSLMSRCFSVSKNDTLYPLERLQEVLAFDDISSTQRFCNFYGFKVDEKHVHFNRTSYMEPDEKCMMMKSYLIDANCADTFAEVVNGGELPADYQYIPTNSFDQDGRYIGKYHIIDDSLCKTGMYTMDEEEEEENVTQNHMLFCKAKEEPRENPIVEKNPFLTDVSKLPLTNTALENPFLTKSAFPTLSMQQEQNKTAESVSKNLFSNDQCTTNISSNITFGKPQRPSYASKLTTKPTDVNKALESTTVVKPEGMMSGQFTGQLNCWQSGNILTSVKNLPDKSSTVIGSVGNQLSNWKSRSQLETLSTSPSKSQQRFGFTQRVEASTYNPFKPGNKVFVNPLSAESLLKSNSDQISLANVFKPKEFLDSPANIFQAPSIEEPSVKEVSFHADICTNKTDENWGPTDQVDNPFLQRNTVKGSPLKEVAVKIDSKDVDLRARLNAKRLKQSVPAVADPDFVVSQEDYDDTEDEEEPIEPSEATIMFLREDITAIAEELLEEHVDETKHNILSEVFKEIKQEKYDTESACHQLLALFCIQEARHAANEAIQEMREAEQKRRTVEFANEVERISKTYLEETTILVLIECCNQVHNEMHCALENERLDKESMCRQQEILSTVLMREVESVSFETLHEMLAERKQRLLALFKRHRTEEQRKTFLRWVKMYKNRMLIKRTLFDFPLQPSLKSVKDVLQTLDPELAGKSKCVKRTGVTKCESMERLQAVCRDYYANLDRFRKSIDCRLPLEHIFESIVKKNSSRLLKDNHLYHYIVVMSDKKTVKNSAHLTADMLIQKLKSNETALFPDILKNYSVAQSNGITNYLTLTSFESDQLEDNSKYLLRGTTGVLFLVEVPLTHTKDFWEAQSRSLKYIMASNDHPTPISIVVLCRTFDSVGEIERYLHLDELGTKYNFAVISTTALDARFVNIQFESSVRWLLNESLPNKPVSTKPLSFFVEDAMATLFFQSFHECGLYCSKMQLPTPLAQDVITFYNRTLDAIASSVLRSLPFNYQIDTISATNTINDASKLKKLSRLVDYLKLPDIQVNDEDDWEMCYKRCVEYVSTISTKSSPLMSRINSLLTKYTSSETMFPWLDILDLFIINRLSSMYSYTTNDCMDYSSSVHHVDNCLQHVENPLNSHIKILNESQYNLETRCDFGTLLKKRKYYREQSLRESIEEVNLRLCELEETTLRRKSNSRSLKTGYHDSVSPMRQLLEETTKLCSDITAEKSNLTLFLPEEELFRHTSSVTEISRRPYGSIDREGIGQSLNGSVMDCLHSIRETRCEEVEKLKYWQMRLEQ